MGRGKDANNAGGAVAFALLAAVALDGVSENLAMGVSLVGDEAGPNWVGSPGAPVAPRRNDA